MITNKRIREIIREEVDALEFFNNLNKKSGELTPWDASTKMDRMKPSRASCAKYIPSKEFKLHSYNDWAANYKPNGISYADYMKMEI